MSSLQPKTPFAYVEETHKRIGQFLREIKTLEETYDGSDGRPTFNRMELETYLNEKVNRGESLVSPRKAFEELHGEELKAWNEQPADKDNLDAKIRATLWEREGAQNE